MVGDWHQGKPVTTSNRGAKPKMKDVGFTNKAFNEFISRGEMSLFLRLILQGFPYIPLRTQYRMHPALLSFPNGRFYAGELRTAPSTNQPLTPELVKTLRRVLQCMLTDNEADLRLQYVFFPSSECMLTGLSQVDLHKGEQVAKVDKVVLKSQPRDKRLGALGAENPPGSLRRPDVNKSGSHHTIPTTG